MNVFSAALSLLLLVTLLGVLVVWGNAVSTADRMLAASLTGALSLSLLLLVAEAWMLPVLDDVALGLAVLGALGVSTAALRAQAADKRAAPPLEKRAP